MYTVIVLSQSFQKNFVSEAAYYFDAKPGKG